MTKFEFVDKDPRAGTGFKNDPTFQEFADALRANPEQWAKYPLTARIKKTGSSIVYRINRADALTPVAFRPDDAGHFQACEADKVIYVRYVKN
jgi:hypothetical protein